MGDFECEPIGKVGVQGAGEEEDGAGKAVSEGGKDKRIK